MDSLVGKKYCVYTFDERPDKNILKYSVLYADNSKNVKAIFSFKSKDDFKFDSYEGLDAASIIHAGEQVYEGKIEEFTDRTIITLKNDMQSVVRVNRTSTIDCVEIMLHNTEMFSAKSNHKEVYLGGVFLSMSRESKNIIAIPIVIGEFTEDLQKLSQLELFLSETFTAISKEDLTKMESNMNEVGHIENSRPITKDDLKLCPSTKRLSNIFNHTNFKKDNYRRLLDSSACHLSLAFIISIMAGYLASLVFIPQMNDYSKIALIASIIFMTPSIIYLYLYSNSAEKIQTIKTVHHYDSRASTIIFREYLKMMGYSGNERDTDDVVTKVNKKSDSKIFQWHLFIICFTLSIISYVLSIMLLL